METYRNIQIAQISKATSRFQPQLETRWLGPKAAVNLVGAKCAEFNIMMGLKFFIPIRVLEEN